MLNKETIDQYFGSSQNKNKLFYFFIPCILILSQVFFPPTDAPVNCLKNNFKNLH